LSVIYIRDGQDLLEIGFNDIEKYHGQQAIMAVAVGFRVLQATFKELFDNEPAQREVISILSGHGGPGFRDAFEFVTRAVTRGTYRVDVEYPQAQYDPYRSQSYAFLISTTDGKSVEIALKNNFLPSRFYDFLTKGRDETLTDEDIVEFDKLKRELAERALAMSQEELLSIQRLS
jgi:hypothetical protein